MLALLCARVCALTPTRTPALVAEAPSSRAIVMLSVGDNRTWVESYVQPRLEAYATRIGAEWQVVEATDVDALEKQLDVPIEVKDALDERVDAGGNQTLTRTADIRIYAYKLLVAQQMLQQYERVLLLDDTVFIRYDAADIFDQCDSASPLCGYPEGNETGCVAEQGTWLEEINYLTEHNIDATPAESINAGAVLFSRAGDRAAAALNDTLSAAALASGFRDGLFDSFFPEQVYLIARIAQLSAAGTSVLQSLPRDFNEMLVCSTASRARDGYVAISPLTDAEAVALMLSANVAFIHVTSQFNREGTMSLLENAAQAVGEPTDEVRRSTS